MNEIHFCEVCDGYVAECVHDSATQNRRRAILSAQQIEDTHLKATIERKNVVNGILQKRNMENIARIMELEQRVIELEALLSDEKNNVAQLKHNQSVLKNECNHLIVERDSLLAENKAWAAADKALGGGKLKSVEGRLYSPNDISIVIDDNVPDSEIWFVSHDRKQFGKITGIGCPEDESDGE